MNANFLGKNKLIFTLLEEAELNTLSPTYHKFLFTCLKAVLTIIINPKNYNIFTSNALQYCGDYEDQPVCALDNNLFGVSL